MNFHIAPDEFKSVIEAAARKAVSEFATQQARLPSGCLSESQAAAWLGVSRHSLRDLRLSGGIKASRIVGRRIRYLPADLIDYVNSKREPQ